MSKKHKYIVSYFRQSQVDSYRDQSRVPLHTTLIEADSAEEAERIASSVPGRTQVHASLSKTPRRPNTKSTKKASDNSPENLPSEVSEPQQPDTDMDVTATTPEPALSNACSAPMYAVWDHRMSLPVRIPLPTLYTSGGQLHTGVEAGPGRRFPELDEFAKGGNYSSNDEFDDSALSWTELGIAIVFGILLVAAMVCLVHAAVSVAAGVCVLVAIATLGVLTLRLVKSEE